MILNERVGGALIVLMCHSLYVPIKSYYSRLIVRCLQCVMGDALCRLLSGVVDFSKDWE